MCPQTPILIIEAPTLDPELHNLSPAIPQPYALNLEHCKPQALCLRSLMHWLIEESRGTVSRVVHDFLGLCRSFLEGLQALQGGFVLILRRLGGLGT